MENITVKRLSIRMIQIIFSIALICIVVFLLLNLIFSFKFNYNLSNQVKIILIFSVLLLSEILSYIALRNRYDAKNLSIGIVLIIVNMLSLYVQDLVMIHKYISLVLLMFLIWKICVLIKRLVK